MRVAIATPCTDQVMAGYAYDLARMMASMSLARPDIEITLHQNKGTIIPQQRATLVMSAREAQATHILWLDSDMRFPVRTLLTLLDHNLPIVACNYSTRRVPILPTAEHRDLGYLFTPEDADGLQPVTHCGMGVMLTAMDVFDKIKTPYFAIGFNPRDGEYGGEDFFFCTKAREAGYQVMIDQELSREIRHIGSVEYTAQHACVTRDLNQPKPLVEVASGA